MTTCSSQCKRLAVIVWAVGVTVGCQAPDDGNTTNGPVTYHRFKLVTDEQVVLLQEEMNDFSYAISNELSRDELWKKAEYIFDFEAMKVITNFGVVEEEDLIRVDSTYTQGDKRIDKYLYGIGKIDGTSLVAFRDSILLFTLNTTWREGVIQDQFYTEYMEEWITYDSLNVFQLNLPPPPPPPLPGHFN